MDENIRKSIAWKTINKMFNDNQQFLIRHHLDSYNSFFEKGIKEIFKDNNPLTLFKEQIVLNSGKKEYKYNFKMYFGGKNLDKIYYGKPVIYDEYADQTVREHYMYPNEARLRNMTYGFTVHYDVEIDFFMMVENTDPESTDKYKTVKDTIILEKKFLGRFPIMLMSKMCILNGLSKETRFGLGECRNDLGGYFIIDGKEKAIVSQEGRADNILYIKSDFNQLYSHVAEIRSVSEDASKPIRTLSIRIVREQTELSNKNIIVNIPNVRKPVPLFIVFRALGVISDKDIITHCLLDIDKYSHYKEYFRPSIHDAGYIFTQTTALQYIASLTKGKTISSVMQILMIYFLPHIGELNFENKALYLGYMVKRLLDVYTNTEKETDRDSFSQKRIEVSGSLIYKLFREYYLIQLKAIWQKIDKEYFYKANETTYQEYDFKNLIINNQNHFFSERTVEIGFRKAFKGDWGAEIHTKRAGVVQDFNRLSYFSALCQLRKTNLPIAADGAKIIPPRLIHSTGWGLLCPVHSPDGGNVGLHKHLSTSTAITNYVSYKHYINYLKSLKHNNDFVGIKLLEECSIKFISKSTKVFINGIWLGVTISPIKLCKTMRLHKRNNIIDKYTSIYFNIRHNEILIYTDSGRPIRPLFYLYNNELSYERGNIIDLYDKNEINWQHIVNGFDKNDEKYITNKKIETLEKNASIIEYIDTNEAEGIVLAKHNDERESYEKCRITHEEIHPSLILSIMANQTIFPEHNPYPRNAFACGQGKQGVSMFHSNFRNRVDKTSLMLNYGQIPLTKSRYYKYATNDEVPYGENAIVAIMCYSGFNVEDAVIINKGFLDRGGFRTTKYEMYETFEESTTTGNTTINTFFKNIEDNDVVDIKPGYDYSNLDKETGIIKENTIIDDKTVLIGKCVYNPTENNYKDMSVFTKKGTVGIIDKAFMTEGLEGKRIAKVRLRSERTPAIGDKFCSRAGQKGTVGIILNEVDMPTTAEGLKPDIIVNPHAMPSRMTIGHMVEAITSKLASIFGGFGDCTVFNNKGSQHEIYGKYLVSQGFEKGGNEVLYNGMTGEQLESDIYIGPTYYLRLKHMPKDKINYRARGPRTVLTRQTVGGRANDGGLRIGEMDRDCLLAHGMNAFIKDSMLVRGDEYLMAVCNQTGCIAAYNEQQNIMLCPFADGPIKFVKNVEQTHNVININKFGRSFSIVRIPYAFKLLMQELQAMNIQMRIITADNINNLMTLSKGWDLTDITGKNSWKEYGEELTRKISQRNTEIVVGDIKPMMDQEEMEIKPSWDVPQNSYFNASPMVFNQPMTNIAYDNPFTGGDDVYLDFMNMPSMMQENMMQQQEPNPYDYLLDENTPPGHFDGPTEQSQKRQGRDRYDDDDDEFAVFQRGGAETEDSSDEDEYDNKPKLKILNDINEDGLNILLPQKGGAEFEENDDDVTEGNSNKKKAITVDIEK